MRKDVEVRLGPGDRERLEAVLADRNKHAWRARIILATAAGCGTAEIMRRDKTSKPGKAPVAPARAARLIELTLGAPPGETTHWTSRDGQGHRLGNQHRAEDLARPRPGAAPAAHLQAQAATRSSPPRSRTWSASMSP